MAELYINEYANLARDLEAKPLAAPQEPALATQKITIGATTESTVFNKRTRFVMLYADGACHYVFGDGTVTATTSDMKMPADGTRFHSVLNTAGAMKLAVIQT